MIFFLVFLFLDISCGKIYDRCELARELKFVHKAPTHQLAIWVCIAEHESQYNTSIVGHLNGDGSGDHGIFQISDQYWCSPPGKGYACRLTCAELEDDDLSDDFICAQSIYKEHKQLSGDGFNAWAVYQPHCKGSKADHYIKDCFNNSEHPKTFNTHASAFAHGFFDMAAEKTHKGSSIPVQKSAFEPLLNFISPSIVQSQKFTFTTERPKVSLLSIPKSTLFANKFFISTEKPNFDHFFNPTRTTFKPIISTTATSFMPTTNTPSTDNLIIFNPTSSALLATTVNRSPIFEFKKTLPMPSSKIIFNPTISTTSLQTSTVSYPAPIFIFNGIKWY